MFKRAITAILVVVASVTKTAAAAPSPLVDTTSPLLHPHENEKVSRAIKLNAVSFFFQTAIVFASNAKLLGGSTNQEISEDYPSLLTPAGYAFSIWGAIYSWELLAVSVPLFTSSSPLHQKAIISTSPYFVAANIFQALWAFSFAREKIALSTVFLTAIAASMARAVALMDFTTPRDQAAFWLLAAPFSMHAGWVAAASIVSVNLSLVQFKGTHAAQIGLAFASLSLACGTGVIALKHLNPGSDALYSASIAWGLLAISSELRKKILPRIDPSSRAALQGTAFVYGGFLTVLTLAAAAFSGTNWKALTWQSCLFTPKE